MASNLYLKYNITFCVYIIISTHALVKATTYLLHNPVSTNDLSKQTLQSGVSQEYFVPYQKYVPSFNHENIISQPESQIPGAATSTEKPAYSSPHAAPLDYSKYVTTQVVKTPQGYPVGYPYVVVVNAVPSTVVSYKTKNDYTEDVPKKYQYGYRVSNPHTGTEFGHSEVNDGLSAKGYYHVLLPDGRLQNVKYWAGPSGYHATITYETQY